MRCLLSAASEPHRILACLWSLPLCLCVCVCVCSLKPLRLCLCVLADKKADARQVCIVRWCLAHTQLMFRRRRHLSDIPALIVTVPIDEFRVASDVNILSLHTVSSCRQLHHCKFQLLCAGVEFCWRYRSSIPTVDRNWRLCRLW